MLDKSKRAEVGVVLGDLGSDLEQDFLDHLEAWDPDTKSLASPRSPTEAVPVGDTSWVLRLCYRIEWDSVLEEAVHWVDFPGESDPASGHFVRVPRRLHELLPVVVVGSRGRPLQLGPRSDFRRVLGGADGGTLGAALDEVIAAVSIAGTALATSGDIKSSVAKVLEPVDALLGVDAGDDDLVQFLPEGGSLSGLLRTLQPALDLGGPGHLPLRRHGATAAALLQAGEALASIGSDDAVVFVEDFGEDLDSMSIRHLSSVFRRQAGQAWVSTRRSAALEPFQPQDIIRLHLKGGYRRAARIEALTTKADRVAARHLSLQLLPAASAAVVAIVEGPHDRTALDALANRLVRRGISPLPAASGIAIVDAGVVDGSGGAPAVARLAALARRLGFHTIGVIDGDVGDDGVAYLSGAEAAADRVIRLPDGVAIERALIDGLDETVVIKTLRAACDAFGLTAPPNLDMCTGSDLLKAAVSILKKNGGLHAQFIELLPSPTLPPTLQAVLDAIVASGNERLEGTLQL